MAGAEKIAAKFIEHGGAAFPCEGSAGLYPDPGMSIRDYFAGQALQYVAKRKDIQLRGADDIAATSYQIADAMLRARSSEEG